MKQTETCGVTNAFSVDVEDYFQVGAFEKTIQRDSWEQFEPRVEGNTLRLLEIMADYEVKATFFVLGWVAERWPGLVREIAAQGHELGVHGYDHRRITSQGPSEFRVDVRTAKRIIEDASGRRMVGYRAPNYSIVRRTLWAIDVLVEEGFLYDSSIFPIHHDHYGIPDFPRFPSTLAGSNGGDLVEFPISTLRLGPINFPFVGGGYLRHLPMSVIRWGMRRLNQVEGKPAIVYIHPWEIDPGQPRQATDFLTGLRHYRNLDKTERRLRALFSAYRFTTVREVLGL